MKESQCGYDESGFGFMGEGSWLSLVSGYYFSREVYVGFRLGSVRLGSWTYMLIYDGDTGRLLSGSSRDSPTKIRSCECSAFPISRCSSPSWLHSRTFLSSLRSCSCANQCFSASYTSSFWVTVFRPDIFWLTASISLSCASRFPSFARALSRSIVPISLRLESS